MRMRADKDVAAGAEQDAGAGGDAKHACSVAVRASAGQPAFTAHTGLTRNSIPWAERSAHVANGHPNGEPVTSIDSLLKNSLYIFCRLPTVLREAKGGFDGRFRI
jgi:hypothetical protein